MMGGDMLVRDLLVAAQFNISLVVGVLLFLGHADRRRPFRWPLFVIGAVSAVAVYHGVAELCRDSVWWVPGMTAYYVVCVLWTMAVVHACYALTWLEAMVTVVAGYAVQHVCADVMMLAFVSQSKIGMAASEGRWSAWGVVAVVYAVIYVVMYWLVARHVSIDHDAIRSRIRWVVLCIFVLALVIVANLVLETAPRVAQQYGYLGDLLCTVLSIAVLMLVSDNDVLASDLALLRQREQLRAEQYELAKETIDLINVSCHDFRNAVASLRRRGAAPSDEAVREVEDGIRVYESVYHTGNESLDVILTEKGLYCQSHGITFDCMADGAALDMLDDAELYALFGNILDNAIEAVERVDRPERRIIDLTVHVSGGLLLIEERNYFQGALSFRDGLPASTKGDDRYHGFGMRSIRRTVERHGGDMAVDAADGMFTLAIAIPNGR